MQTLIIEDAVAENYLSLTSLKFHCFHENKVSVLRVYKRKSSWKYELITILKWQEHLWHISSVTIKRITFISLENKQSETKSPVNLLNTSLNKYFSRKKRQVWWCGMKSRRTSYHFSPTVAECSPSWLKTTLIVAVQLEAFSTDK